MGTIEKERERNPNIQELNYSKIKSGVELEGLAIFKAKVFFGSTSRQELENVFNNAAKSYAASVKAEEKTRPVNDERAVQLYKAALQRALGESQDDHLKMTTVCIKGKDPVDSMSIIIDPAKITPRL